MVKHSLILIAFFLISICGYTQNFQPFSMDSHKRFECVTDNSLPDEFFYAIGSETTGTTLHLDHFLKRGAEWTELEPVECPFWGGALHRVDTTWLGINSSYDSMTETLVLQNGEDEELTFDFGMTIGDSSQFYQNSELNAYIIAESGSQESILGYVDEIRNFRIQLYDPDGSSYDSPLNGQIIQLGIELGLISFFSVQDFPSSQQFYTLKGQTEPQIGDYMMTYDQIYPWHEGDEIQYLGRVEIYNFGLFKTYQHIQVTSRVETPDSVFIYYDSSMLYEAFGMISNDLDDFFEFEVMTIQLPNPIAFRKNTYIIDKPLEYVELTNGELHTSILEAESTCNGSMILRSRADHELFCDGCTCLGGVDGFMLTFPVWHYEEGHGIRLRTFNVYGPPESPSRSAYSIYTNIAGVECGELFTVGLEDLELNFEIFPNPATDQVKIARPNQHKASYFIYDATGRAVKNEALRNELIDISDLDKGLYLIQLSSGKQKGSSILIKE